MCPAPGARPGPAAVRSVHQCSATSPTGSRSPAGALSPVPASIAAAAGGRVTRLTSTVTARFTTRAGRPMTVPRGRGTAHDQFDPLGQAGGPRVVGGRAATHVGEAHEPHGGVRARGRSAAASYFTSCSRRRWPASARGRGGSPGPGVGTPAAEGFIRALNGRAPALSLAVRPAIASVAGRVGRPARGRRSLG